MSSEPSLAPSAPSAAPASGATGVQRAAMLLLGVVAVAGLATSILLWQRLGSIQEQLARQSADAGAQSIEARTLANQALDMSRDVSARIAVNETRVSEVALQRSQLEELMQSLSRSRDENLVVDIESALRLAQQQAQLTGSLEPVVAALKSANQRIERAAQPRLAPVARAIGRDIDRVGAAQVTDTAGLLARLDDLMRQVDELPLQNAVAQAAATRRMNAAGSRAPEGAAADTAPLPWWQATLQRGWEVVRDEARQLLRVTRIDRPEAILIAPDQAFFLRENLKLQLMNARLAILARQYESARADLASASHALGRYFDPAARRTQSAATVLQQAQMHLKGAALPTLDETFAALATAAAGR
ncbi:uroporphyrinogen-III C-methyltransferase [Acidovorax sp. NCPPB 4044]|uniref:uroporphyrinogen-III C-methyltransferase n=1 Tax=Acidovorax sp. NCPPB 4044 TaxID=2940490 RepID=UPI002302FCD3|nr:uroporphyrinogen-III C-methyltransferase [Acidovorax sp. NCPPB 4044]MDA8521698.1 uroporphyrinogen-III C-methyltransferase [Acidovorax sp. NCPPB 4044]